MRGDATPEAGIPQNGDAPPEAGIPTKGVVVCMEQHHAFALAEKFGKECPGAWIQIWGIEDVYDYMDDELVWGLRRKAEREGLLDHG